VLTRYAFALRIHRWLQNVFFAWDLNSPEMNSSTSSSTSDRSLLDADIVLFQPGFGEFSPTETYHGEDLFSHTSSPRLIKILQHWKSELTSAVDAGKLVVVFLAKPRSAHVYTGQQGFSGTGRSRVTTNYVAEIESYSAVPIVTAAEAKTGREIILTKDGLFLSGYWKEFGENSEYEAFIDGKFTKTILTTKTGGKVVGALVRRKGALLLIPPLRYDEEKFTKYNPKKQETYWTTEAVQYGKRLVVSLVSLTESLLKRRYRNTSAEMGRSECVPASRGSTTRKKDRRDREHHRGTTTETGSCAD
jgi:hypothetical protein